MTRAMLLSVAILAACSPIVGAKDAAKETTKAPDVDAFSKIAERDLRKLKELLPGIYANQEQFYFQDNLDLPEDYRLPHMTLTIEADGDDFKATTENQATGEKTEAALSYTVKDGKIHSTETRDNQPDCNRVFTRKFEQFRGEGCGGDVTVSDTGLTLGDPKNPFQMRRANIFKCWVSPQKNDGTYAFYNDIILHDQGGRAWVSGDDHDRMGLKIRKVIWPVGNNRPSLVLYAYRGDDEDKAVSYAWTGPDSDRIAFNMRWMQASCTQGDETIKPGINLKTGSGR